MANIFEAIQHALEIERALYSDDSPIAPTITLRGQLKCVLVAADRRGLFTWYESLGVWLLTRRRG